MKIGLDASALCRRTRYTGMGEYTANLLVHLVRANTGHDYVIFAPPGQAPPPELRGDFHWRPLPRVKAGKFSALVSHQLILPWLAAAERLDVLHIPGVNVLPSLPGVPLWSPCPLVVTLHDVIPLTFYGATSAQPLPRKLRLFYRTMLWAASRANRIITVSSFARREILAHLSVAPEKVVAIHNGITSVGERDIESPETGAEGIGAQSPFILFAGSYEPRKNLQGMLEAYHYLVAQGFSHRLVALVERESGHAAALHALVKSLGLQERVVFLHSLSDSDLRAVYRAAALLVFPSLCEGFGFPPLQAMQCGTPVVASDIAVLHETLGNAVCFIDPYQPKQIAEGIRSVLADEGYRRHLVEDGRVQAARFRWEEAARLTVQVYEQAVGHVALQAHEIKR